VSWIQPTIPPAFKLFFIEREFIAERQRALQDWLVSLLACADLATACLVVKRFLDPTNYSTSFQGTTNRRVQ
jgi:hypothetical protein